MVLVKVSDLDSPARPENFANMMATLFGRQQHARESILASRDCGPQLHASEGT